MIWTQNPSEIHCVNLFKRRDGYFRMEIHFQMYINAPRWRFILLQMQTWPITRPHACMCTAGALSTGEQNRGWRQTRLPFSKLMLVFVYVCVCLLGMFWHIHSEHALAQWHPFRSRCPGLSVAVLNGASVSNEIPIFTHPGGKRGLRLVTHAGLYKWVSERED